MVSNYMKVMMSNSVESEKDKILRHEITVLLPKQQWVHAHFYQMVYKRLTQIMH
ncbi:hypothetical protein [Acinetobacter baumannii]|uniref:hypothetical protein n=1 Tax=Acinetobacter baumannii TaxID=470 RepID=UPI001D194E99|nr:hypothetical protein [Acinetobacter baumannii]